MFTSAFTGGSTSVFTLQAYPVGASSRYESSSGRNRQLSDRDRMLIAAYLQQQQQQQQQSQGGRGKRRPTQIHFNEFRY